MKKLSLFFVCLFTVLITGCSNDDFSERGSSNTKRSKTAHWYGVKQLQDSVSLRSAADRMKLWAQDPVITVKFLNSTDDAAMLDQIKTYAKEWEQYAGITFRFVESSEDALVRIGFDWNDNSWLTWSYTGNDAKMVRSQSEPTACFGGFNDGVMSDEEIKGDVLRVFGQILGLEFEQRHQGWDESWWKKDKNGVYYAEKYWDGMFDGYYENLDWATIRQFVFDPLAGATIVQTADVDFESIMMWPYYTKKESLKLYANYELSVGDKEFIATLYPKKEGNTIQTAWVDAGYFTWVNEEKTWLHITEKGAQMEYLPDVVDGEQLTSASRMFSYARFMPWHSAMLKKAPMFNTCNITDFSAMFLECTFLIEVPCYNTSKGEDFSNMFGSCYHLPNVPLFDTSSGKTFLSMFYQCLTLVDIPLFDTSKGVYFNCMFQLAKRLITIPLLDTSKGLGFSAMFDNCRSLQSIPELNTSNGLVFSRMFQDCEKLTTIPNLDTSKGEIFTQMFWGALSIKVFPELDVSKGQSFEGMFNYSGSAQDVKLKGFGEGGYFYDYQGNPLFDDLDIRSSVLEISSLQYLVDNTTGCFPARTINLNKKIQPKVSPELIAQAAAKNITFEFIY